MITELKWDPSTPESIDEAGEFLKQSLYHVSWIEESCFLVIKASDSAPAEVQQIDMRVSPGEWIEFNGARFGWGRRSKGD